ncbi:HAD family phosphatase [Vibrio sp. JPW-9-11-11]|uniref:Cof-type HAD-IIB family hydrolase n=1 Tax=Vibrio sp. JPW-9-11-11 TaxID=1416532 RepID=UPI001593C8EB|nr:Cof-type HAD-IIB family hydrolase [Vibrio sp. JPW-9-11-11]NVD06600.1 HAD family phosphatase [Vibrio sp. JPW-9-11-11]
MYKLIALDMDGTLLTSDKTISDQTKLAIQAARQQGVKVVLASGRPLDGMQAKLDELNIDGDNEFVVYFNGSMVKELGSDKLIHTAIIDGAKAKKVAALAQQLNLDCHAFSTEYGLITPRLNPHTDIEATINQIPVTEMAFDQLADDHPIIKVMIVGEPEKLSAAINQIPPQYHKSFTVVQSAPFFLEFLNLDSNKGVGVGAIAEYLGVTADEVICVGDAENDHHMLQYAGLGVAMENAMPQTKQIADYITASNDDDGVAKVIERFILNAR